MTPALIAEFDQADRFLAALASWAAPEGRLLDAIAPFHLPQFARAFGPRLPRVHRIMAAAGFSTALLVFGLQCWSAALAYPLDSGDRPLFSWQVFVLASFEVGVLAAAIAGFITFLRGGGLPDLRNASFGYPGFERASQDRFFLLIARTGDEEDDRARRELFDAGAISIGTVDS